MIIQTNFNQGKVSSSQFSSFPHVFSPQESDARQSDASARVWADRLCLLAASGLASTLRVRRSWRGAGRGRHGGQHPELERQLPQQVPRAGQRGQYRAHKQASPSLSNCLVFIPMSLNWSQLRCGIADIEMVR